MPGYTHWLGHRHGVAQIVSTTCHQARSLHRTEASEQDSSTSQHRGHVFATKLSRSCPTGSVRALADSGITSTRPRSFGCNRREPLQVHLATPRGLRRGRRQHPYGQETDESDQQGTRRLLHQCFPLSVSNVFLSQSRRKTLEAFGQSLQPLEVPRGGPRGTVEGTEHRLIDRVPPPPAYAGVLEASAASHGLAPGGSLRRCFARERSDLSGACSAIGPRLGSPARASRARNLT